MRRRVCHVGHVCVLAVTLGRALIGSAIAAPAETPDAAGTTLPLRLEIILLDTRAPPTLKSRLESWFSSGTQVTILEQPSNVWSAGDYADTQFVAIWVAMASAGQAEITYGFRDPTSQEVRLVRGRLSLRDGLDELGQERLARVIHSSVMALLEGRVQEVGVPVEASSILGVPRAATMSAPAASLPPPPRNVSELREPAPVSTSVRIAHRSMVTRLAERPRRGWLGVGYAVTLRGREGMALGPALTVGLRAVRSLRLNYGLQFESRLIVPTTFELESIRIQTSGARFRLVGDVEFRMGQTASFEIGLGAGLDVNHYTSSRTYGASIDPTPPGTDPQLCITPSLRLWTVAPLEIGLGVHLDVLPTNGRYFTSASDPSNQRFIEAWRLQPGFSIALRWPGQTS